MNQKPAAQRAAIPATVKTWPKWRELKFHHNVTVLRTIGYLIFARKAVWILRSVKHTADKPLDGLSITSRERRLATRDVSVLHCSTCPFLRDLAVVVLGLRLCDCPLPLRNSWRCTD